MDNIEITQPQLKCWKKNIHLKTVVSINFATQGLGLDLNNDRREIIERCIDDLTDEMESRFIPTPENIRKKDQVISVVYQGEAKLHDDKEEYDESWTKYTKAIAYALPDSIELTSAFLNRSGTLFKVRMYDDCLKDLNRLKYMKVFPDNAKLSKNLRAYKSHKNIADRELSTSMEYAHNTEAAKMVDDDRAPCMKFSSEVVPISLKTNNLEIPGLSDSTELNYSREYGRHITAKKNIKFGEVIGVEHAYASNIVQDLKYNFCGYCKKQTWSSIPCNNCAHVVYCSESCKMNADNEYHKIECKIIPYLLAFGIKDKYLLALRITIMGILERIHRPDKIPKKNSFSLGPRNRGFMNGRLRPDAHTSVVSMQASISEDLIGQECVSLADCFIMSFFLLIHMDNLPSDHNGDFKDLKKRKEFMDVVGLIDKSVRVLMNNGHEVMIPKADDVNNSKIHMGSAIIVPFSLFNHSCQPMVIVSRHGNQFIMRALCPIKKGQQIFTSYGVAWYSHSKETRQEYLSFYNFTCKCDACCGNWILSDKKPVNKDKIDKNINQMVDALIKNVKDCQLQNISLYYLSENSLMMKPHSIEIYSKVFDESYELFNVKSQRAVQLLHLFSSFIGLSQAPFIQLNY